MVNINTSTNNHYSSLIFPSVACVGHCDTCDFALNTCTNCADGYDVEPVCTGKKKINNLLMGT